MNDDEGLGIFGEVGIGYAISPCWRLRLGVNAHGVDSDATRFDGRLDGRSRWLWTFAPVAEVEFDF